MKALTELKVGDVVGVKIDDVFGNAHRVYKELFVSAVVTNIGRKWISVKTEHGREWRFDKTGTCEDINEGITLFPTPEEAKREAEKLKMVRKIRACGFDFLARLSYEEVERIYLTVCKDTER